MRRSIGSATSPLAPAAGASNETSSPPLRRWLFGRAAPSTSTAPSPTNRSATARDPTDGSPARKRSSRSPAAASGTRRRGVGHALPAPRLAFGEDQRDEQDPDSDDDEAVREVEGRPEAQVEEVRHVPEPHPVDEVRDAAADNEPERDGQDRMPRAGAGEEPEHPRDGDPGEDDHDRRRAGEEAERDPRVLDMVDGERADHAHLLVEGEAARDDVLRQLVGREGRGGHRDEGGPLAGARGERPPRH